MHIILLNTQEKVVARLAKEIEKAAHIALVTRNQNHFNVAIGGGNLIDYLADALPKVRMNMLQWRLYLSDERYVPHTDPESNVFKYAALIKSRFSTLTDKQFVKADTELPLEVCAASYEKRIQKDFKINRNTLPNFDLLLLSVSPDGHICALFPGSKALKLSGPAPLITYMSDAPKPPPARITMTLPVLNAARSVVFVATGASKAEVVRRAFYEQDDSLPAALINPDHVTLILDKEAAKHLSI